MQRRHYHSIIWVGTAKYWWDLEKTQSKLFIKYATEVITPVFQKVELTYWSLLVISFIICSWVLEDSFGNFPVTLTLKSCGYWLPTLLFDHHLQVIGKIKTSELNIKHLCISSVQTVYEKNSTLGRLTWTISRKI